MVHSHDMSGTSVAAIRQGAGPALMRWIWRPMYCTQQAGKSRDRVDQRQAGPEPAQPERSVEAERAPHATADQQQLQP